MGRTDLFANSKWQVPESVSVEFFSKRSELCVCIPVINEDGRIQILLERMNRLKIMQNYDVIVADGGSTDGSLEEGFLNRMNVRVLLTKKGAGKLGSQMRMAMAYGVNEEYKGFIFIDGNNKDDPEAIPRFAAKLEAGYDFIQGSRYLPGGLGVNTPLFRHYAIRYLHVPLVSFAAGRRFTDTTNGFRAYSSRFLLDPRVNPFRDVFSSYELLFYLAIRSSRIAMKVTEIPVTRTYPVGEKISTKISFFRGNWNLFKILIKSVFFRYDP